MVGEIVGEGMTLDELQKLCERVPSIPKPYDPDRLVGQKEHEIVATILSRVHLLIAVARAAEDAVGATLLHDWKPLEAALAALDSL